MKIFILLFLILIVLLVLNFIYEEKYYKYISSVNYENTRYSLYNDNWFQDSYWVILKDDIGNEDYKKVKIIDISFTDDKKNILFLNWSDWISLDKPIIKIFKDKYLVFERGWLYHSLYDIKLNKIIINYEDIKFEINRNNDFKLDKSLSEKFLLNWKNKNLHNKILELINN